MPLTYCKKCLIPSSKPHVRFNGKRRLQCLCEANLKKHRIIDGIDWKKRENEFREIVISAKAQKAPFFDAMVSGERRKG